VSPRRPADPFARQPHNRGKGRSAEDQAVAWLEEHGYRIVARNVATAAGEIDVVARDGETLCFVEIKARAGPLYGLAIEAVDRRKQRRLARAASLYLMLDDAGRDRPCRFDVLGIDQGENGWEFTLIANAFTL
jgi:putative endonuclease